MVITVLKGWAKGVSQTGAVVQGLSKEAGFRAVYVMELDELHWTGLNPGLDRETGYGETGNPYASGYFVSQISPARAQTERFQIGVSRQ